MAEVTYYCNAQSGSAWTDSAYMVDGILTNYAYTSNQNAYANLSGTNCDGSDLGTITKVELRVYGYGDGDDRIDLGFYNIPLDPEYQTTPGDTPGWTPYVDVTDDPNIGGWTWAKIANIPGNLIAQYDKVGKGNNVYCAKVEIRVTFTPVGPPEKVTQYLAGLDLPEFPHEMDLLSDKLPCPPPY